MLQCLGLLECFGLLECLGLLEYVSSIEFRRDFAGEPVAESRNVGCSLRLLLGPKFEYAVGKGGGGDERQIWRQIST